MTGLGRAMDPNGVSDRTISVRGGSENVPMRSLFGPPTSKEAADRAAREWSDAVDHAAAVGARHHIVPRFLLARFANPQGRLRVRNRVTGSGSIRGIGDMAVRDFYTAVTDARVLDASFETLLSEIEGAAAEVLHTHLDATAFARPRPLSDSERFKIDTFVSMQYVRGMRVRRGLEIMTDYGVKLLNQDKLSVTDIDELDIVPHSNDHLRMIAPLSEHAFEELAMRSLTIVTIDQPLLITGDEPVVLLHEGPRPKVNPNGYANVSGPGIDPRDIVQFHSPHGGFGGANEIALAVSPTSILVYGPRHDGWVGPPQRLSGREATAAAKEHNATVIDGAIDWVAAHPDHAWFKTVKMPPPTPIMSIIDGGSQMARRANSSKDRKPINRLRADDVNIEPLPEGPTDSVERAG